MRYFNTQELIDKQGTVTEFIEEVIQEAIVLNYLQDCVDDNRIIITAANHIEYYNEDTLQGSKLFFSFDDLLEYLSQELQKSQ